MRYSLIFLSLIFIAGTATILKAQNYTIRVEGDPGTFSKDPDILLEVYAFDLPDMNWYQAKKACKKIGRGWRLPLSKELKAMEIQMRVNSWKLGGNLKTSGIYWTSTCTYYRTEYGPRGNKDYAYTYGFDRGPVFESDLKEGVIYDRKDNHHHVRPVRTVLKYPK